MSEIVKATWRLPADLHRRIEALAERERRSLNAQVIHLLETHPEVVAMTTLTGHQEMEVRRLAQERLLDRRDAIERGEAQDYSLIEADLDAYFESEPDLDSPEARRIFREEWETGAAEMASATTYTIVCHRESGALLACVPDGADWRKAVRRDMEAIGEDMPADHEIEVHIGCILADEYDDYDRVVYVGDLTGGTLSDVAGQPYRYALRP